MKYSDLAAPGEQSIIAGVYLAALEDVDHSFTLEDSLSAIRRRLGEYTQGSVRLPGYWEDSITDEIKAALADSPLIEPADPRLITEVASTRGLALENGHEGGGQRRLWLSRPGFNNDSTIAVIRSVELGPSFGLETVLLLARRPGYRWKVFHGLVLGGYIS